MTNIEEEVIEMIAYYFHAFPDSVQPLAKEITDYFIIKTKEIGENLKLRALSKPWYTTKSGTDERLYCLELKDIDAAIEAIRK